MEDSPADIGMSSIIYCILYLVYYVCVWFIWIDSVYERREEGLIEWIHSFKEMFMNNGEDGIHTSVLNNIHQWPTITNTSLNNINNNSLIDTNNTPTNKIYNIDNRMNNDEIITEEGEIMDIYMDDNNEYSDDELYKELQSPLRREKKKMNIIINDRLIQYQPMIKPLYKSGYNLTEMSISSREDIIIDSNTCVVMDDCAASRADNLMRDIISLSERFNKLWIILFHNTHRSEWVT